MSAAAECVREGRCVFISALDANEFACVGQEELKILFPRERQVAADCARLNGVAMTSPFGGPFRKVNVDTARVGAYAIALDL